jgi:chromosomal replication initiation ATPase DnaA
VAPEPQADAAQEWIERQKNIPLPKEPWFCIVAEIEPSEPRRPTIKEIQIAVAKHFKVTRADILCARRTVVVVRPRQVGYYLSQVLTLRSLPEIGRMFGGRDHTSALSGIRKIERLRKTDPQLEADLHAIAVSLGGSVA